jgi:hypothetical protein
MRAKRVKALRHAVGYHPAQEREYDVKRTGPMTGMLVNTGKRASYRRLKASRALSSFVLKAKGGRSLAAAVMGVAHG